MKTVSIIIPCYNGEKFLREAIVSALEQTYPDKEVIVVDDGSTDNSHAIMQEYLSTIKIIRQKNAGLPNARNAGVHSSTGQFLAFLDCDDWWDLTFLEKMMSAIPNEETIGYCGWQNVGLDGGKGAPYVPPDYEKKGSKLETLLQSNIWPVHAAVISRTVFESAGGFNPKWNSCEDFDLWLRTSLKTKAVLVPHVLAYYRHHTAGQMTKNRFRIAKNHWLIQKEFLNYQRTIKVQFGHEKIANLTKGELVRKGLACYWDNDLKNARQIFRFALRNGCLKLKDLKYILPSFLPFSVHRFLINCFRRG